MSLQLNTPITTTEGIEIPSAYGRVAVLDTYGGESLTGQVNFYYTEAAFIAGAEPLRINGIATVSNTPYVRTPASVDLLEIAHRNLQVVLTDQGIDSTINL